MTTTQTYYRSTSFPSHQNNNYTVSRSSPSTSYQKSGLLGKLETAVSSLTNTTINIGKKAGTQLDYLVHSNITKESQQRWWSFGITDTLLGEFPCKCISGNKVVKGFLLLSYEHACFLSSPTGTLDSPIRAVIPLSSVLEIRPCEVISTGQGTTPTFREANLMNASTMSTKKAVQIFTNDRMIHQFFGFKLLFNTVFQTLQRSLQMARQRRTRSVSQPQVYQQTQTVYNQPQQTPIQSTYPPSPYPSNVMNVRSHNFVDPAVSNEFPVENRTNSGSLYPNLNVQTPPNSQQKQETQSRNIYPQQESVRPLTFAELKAMQAS